jgi:hypothetical protein
MNRMYLTTAFLLAWLSLAAAQNNVVYPPPTPPLVAPVPENAEWVLTVSERTNQAVKPAAAPQAGAKNVNLKEIHITKMGKVKRDVLTYSNGTSFESWYADGAFLSPGPNGGFNAIQDGVLAEAYGNELGNPQQSAGFTGLDWLNLKYYDHVILYQGQLCYHYVIKVTSPAINRDMPTDTPIPPPPLSAEAWINAKTGQPVAYIGADGKLYTYSFLDAPTAPLILPPAYQTVLTTYEKAQTDRKRLEDAAAAFQRH